MVEVATHVRRKGKGFLLTRVAAFPQIKKGEFKLAISRYDLQKVLKYLDAASENADQAESYASTAESYAKDAHSEIGDAYAKLEEMMEGMDDRRREELESDLTQVILDAVPKVQDDVRNMIRDEISVLQDKVSQHINLALHQILDQVKEKLEEGGDE